MKKICDLCKKEVTICKYCKGSIEYGDAIICMNSKYGPGHLHEKCLTAWLYTNIDVGEEAGVDLVEEVNEK